MRSYLAPLTLLALVGGISSLAAAGEPVQVVYTVGAQAPTSTRSAIPGPIPGDGIPADPRFTNFNNKIYRAPTTGQWLVVATTNLTPGTADQVLLIGSGLLGSIAAREGITSYGSGEFINFSLLSVPRLNDRDQWAMGFRLAGGTTADERLVKWDGTGYTVLKGGDNIPDSAGGGTYVGSFNGANIANSGEVGFLAASGGGTTNESAYGDTGNSRIIYINNTIPTGQSSAIPSVVSDLTANAFYQDSSGSHSIALGKVGIDTSIDVVAIVDGAVVLQKGSVIAGMVPASPVNTIADVWMESNADWFARGANADGTAWLVRNGAVIAQSGKPIFPGSTELWESFRDVKGNNVGHFVISGNTNNATTLIDDVLVLNGTRVVARESDPVDLNANGLFEGSLYVHLIQNNDTYNTDGYYYFASRLKDAPTSTAGAAGSNNSSLLRVHICPADFDGNGHVEPADIAGMVNTWFQSLIDGSLSGDFDHNNAVQPADVAVFVSAWFNALSGFCQ